MTELNDNIRRQVIIDRLVQLLAQNALVVEQMVTNQSLDELWSLLHTAETAAVNGTTVTLINSVIQDPEIQRLLRLRDAERNRFFR